jgi:hypothetical protein
MGTFGARPFKDRVCVVFRAEDGDEAATTVCGADLVRTSGLSCGRIGAKAVLTGPVIMIEEEAGGPVQARPIKFMHNSPINSTTGSQDQVRINFDWDFPIANLVRFKACIERADQRSMVDFEVDLQRLTPVELQRLGDFLARRHANRTTAVEVTRVIAWLADISLSQTRVDLSVPERLALVRQLLLVGVSQGAGHVRN